MTDSAALPVGDLEEFRPALVRHCYRMLGGVADAEDAAAEALTRALARADRFTPGRPLAPWLYRIATNVCLDELRGRHRRLLSTSFGLESEPGAPLGDPLPDAMFVEPVPDPGDIAVEREGVRLAFVAALQWLPPRQRAVLILRDVLAFTADETAAILETSTAAVVSLLQRARTTLVARRGAPSDAYAPLDPVQADLLARYVDAFERHDVEAFAALLQRDAISDMPPFRWWVRGRFTIARLLALGGCDGAKLAPAVVSGGPGFGQYRPDQDGVLRPFALVALEIRGPHVSRMTTFLGTAERFGEFGLPAVLER
ncbi:RNA polymerase subunit sigma-70 [Tsukamurella sp. 8F]|uniref:RNA polymerase subunit sigma-70 n=1 Tax=unclassified Tsukamurella TaxID=2633480 RepID=UPI0023BA170B|nr:MULTISPECIES: RNA polymerase subunit sigma-70 [unclassified Tsukamurella]MDF0531929.1 RNA polymerase subunit sigma-70 [Tsukamurella sp. 8J]MDF0586931.1 RNA polymerase subunit sigma-70 [Tsukamurella sp. 8F]